MTVLRKIQNSLENICDIVVASFNNVAGPSMKLH